MPNYRPYYPRINKNISVLIGEPMEFTDLLNKMKEQKKTPVINYNFQIRSFFLYVFILFLNCFFFEGRNTKENN